MLKNSYVVYNRVNSIKAKSKIARSPNNQAALGDRKSILCAYHNRTSSIQIIKIENIADFFWEKVVFPSQIILFNSVGEAELKVYSNDNATAALTDTISCLKLQVHSS